MKNIAISPVVKVLVVLKLTTEQLYQRRDENARPLALQQFPRQIKG